MATSSALGGIPILTANTNIEVWLERLDHYFTCKEVKEEAKVATLVTAIGEEAYTVLRNLCLPAKVSDKSLAQLTKILEDHYAPKPSELAARFRFQRRLQQPGESLAEFVASLKALSSHCNFSASPCEHCHFGGTLDERLRDQLVFGLHSDAYRAKLLEEKNPTFNSLQERVLSLEAVERSSSEMAQKSAAQVAQLRAHQLNKRQGPKPALEGSQQRKGGGNNSRSGVGSSGNTGSGTCASCGGAHSRQQCKLRDAKCHACGKTGHIRKVCRSAKLHFLQEATPTPPPEASAQLPIFAVQPAGGNAGPTVQLQVNGQPCRFVIDTGSAVTLMPEFLQLMLLPRLSMSPSVAVLRTFTDEQFRPLGQALVSVQQDGQQLQLPLLIVKHGDTALLGRDWLAKLRLDWPSIMAQVHAVHDSEDIGSIVKEFAPVFEDGLGEFRHGQVRLQVSEDAQPRFFKPRPVPYALRERVDAELQRMESSGIITAVKHSDWAAPIVPVVKKDGSVRICGDYKLTYNAASKPEHYPLPRIEDLFAKLGGGCKWTKLDLSNAFLQLPLADDSKAFLTINTPRGLFQVNRLPFGITSASAIFQRTLDTLLGDLDAVQVFVDDILVTGSTLQQHKRNLALVLRRLKDAGLRLNKEKCKFFEDSVEYLGHRIDASGLKPLPDRVAAVQDAPAPKDVSQLRSFLGMLAQYCKFLPNLSTVLAPLHQLLAKNTRWSWGPPQQQAFAEAKRLLLESPILVHYNPNLPLRLECDASPYGLGVVLTHRIDDKDCAVAFASRSLTAAQRGYSQLDKEALAIMFGLHRFHQFLYGRRFTIVTDHLPLLGLLGERKGIPAHAAARMQRWAIRLSSYDYTLEFRPTEKHANCDSLSRLPLPHLFEEEPAVNSLLLDEGSGSAITALAVARHTRTDVSLGRVLRCLQTGAPIGDDLSDFARRQSELSVDQDCVLWGARVVVPTALRQRVIQELHQAHPGISRMRALARSYVWWPGLDGDLEAAAKSCRTCQLNQPDPPKAPVQPWPLPSEPWERLHIDFAGPVDGHTYLVVVDAHSKWPEVQRMRGTTSAATIAALREMFARQGIPRTLVSDNGPQFASAEFAEFTRANGIRHVFSAPFHPATNGQAERFVQVLKRHLLKSGHSDVELQRLLLSYRNTPHSISGAAPSQLLIGRRLRCRLDLLAPSLADDVQRRQERQLQGRRPAREFQPGDHVLLRDYSAGARAGDTPRWAEGVVTGAGSRNYTVDSERGQHFRHADQLVAARADSADTVHSPPATDDGAARVTAACKALTPQPSPTRPAGRHPALTTSMRAACDTSRALHGGTH
ncbi:hypothetical protein BOX15_Mlig026022g1 [Macrostomum lignano]|uniref:Reverse transcriptase n=1 Tax=Macrostomum lignano TaxID=282301 RepID=A0A267FRX0_9PLAT|nr:hypothetical protein BOX15_Mlig026022g1 [Macrostomum lignano]